MQELGELDPHRPAAQHDRALGQLGERRGLAVGPEPDLVQPWDRGDVGSRSGREDDARRAQPFTAHLHHLLGDDPALAAVDVDPLLAILGDLLGVVEAADHVVAVGDQLLPAPLGNARARRALGLREDLGGPQQGLGGDARPVRALAADQLALDQRRAQPQTGQARGDDLAGGP